MRCDVSEQPEYLRVSVWRGAGVQGAYEDFDVPAQANQTILDVVSYIQQYLDPSLSYRFACRVGMCGSCAMMVNGEPRWTCRTHVKKVTQKGELRIAPLRNLPVIKDLAADMDPFFDKWVKAGGVHAPSRSRHDEMAKVDPHSEARQAANAGIECINCAVCHAACDTITNNPLYPGPAPLQRVWTLYNDERVQDRENLLQNVLGEGGCLDCHSQGSCTRYCPNELNPLQAIAGLKRAGLWQWRKAGG